MWELPSPSPGPWELAAAEGEVAVSEGILVAAETVEVGVFTWANPRVWVTRAARTRRKRRVVK